ncbi:MAG: hypothetical protein JWL84_2578 [Rhodospirillales bacterium]|jgi:hypothetical protein|nr:hypothetical protein [Rhodospirillales bacterium]
MRDAVEMECLPAGAGRRNEDRDRKFLESLRQWRGTLDGKATVRPSLILHLICRLIPEM